MLYRITSSDKLRLYLDTLKDERVKAARHNADNKVTAVQLLGQLLEKTKDPDRKEELMQKIMIALDTASNEFRIYLEIKDLVFQDLCIREGLKFDLPPLKEAKEVPNGQTHPPKSVYHHVERTRKPTTTGGVFRPSRLLRSVGGR